MMDATTENHRGESKYNVGGTEKMGKISMEEIVTELVVNGGNARSKALEAIRAAKRNEMEKAQELIKECNDSLNKAHEFQTETIQSALNSEDGSDSCATLLMVHGQDHLMDAMAVRDLAIEMIEMYKLIHSK